MKHLCKEIGLEDKSYNNHCIRSTVMNILGEKYKARHIMGLSEHKSESSIKQYAVKLPESKKKEMFTTLINLVELKTKMSKLSHTCEAKASVSNNPPPAGNIGTNPTFDLPNFDLVPVDFDDTFDDDLLLKVLDNSEQQLLQDLNIVPSTNYPNKENTDTEAVIPNNANVITKMTNTHNVNINVPTTSYQIQKAPRMPMIPGLYFPNSNVTINYNFSK